MSGPFYYRTKTQVNGTKLRVSTVHVEDLGGGKEVESTIVSHEIDTALMEVRGALLELGWSPPEKRPDPKTETTTVPVVLAFDHTKPIGWLKVRTNALPPDPGFVFSIGYRAFGRGGPDTGPYQMLCVSLLRDEDYANYLRAKGKL